jgi:hypothetical protein
MFSVILNDKSVVTLQVCCAYYMKLSFRLRIGMLNILRNFGSCFQSFQNLTLNTINMQKPHVALFYHRNKPQEEQWADVLSFVEYTFSNLIFSHNLVVY